ncbi:MAG: leucine--tRNA ligase [Candidatus Sungiibacteriota bacterium]|uniref:Leucine--tRNA ligase n=1 Tax=Candidatus Sungiibacteriota bacterium TaxID=2750080 RepID=A0A7T5UQ96_9BACT|nr:MAG: leucine--tRNA ligase [Candidatus Sungbacteria bacterium]
MRYDPKTIEKKWQARWLKEKTYEPDLRRAKKPFYNLMMFPYPSAEGLHVGNMYAFVGADIYGRFKRMQGYDVFEPIGLDGFGIHSENYALKIKKHPADQAKVSEKNFYRQLETVGNGFAWQEKLETYDPDYYRWTQWIFIQMYKHGLAYRKKAQVNWCPSCLTVLADEQVLAGECERCETEVIKKELEQWFFKITDYAERLLKNLDTLDWSERIKIAQRNWIGKSEGALLRFNVRCQMSDVRCPSVEVFTTRPDTLFGATYIVLGPEHQLISKIRNQISNIKEVEGYITGAKTKTDEERIAEGKEKNGVELKGIKATNPANGEEIPIWVADYVLGNVGTGAIMAVPAHDERDMEFAKKFNLPVSNAPFVDKEEIVRRVGGKKTVNYRLRDWLISRQRYWGPPIPMIYCHKCGWIPVPEKDLPVRLPYIKEFRPTGTEKSPLALVEKFYKVRCPKCKSWARRETDVSDTFLDSAWYYIGYLMAAYDWKLEIGNLKLQEAMRKWLPVDMYIGGAEHAVLHLLYVRFLAMAFRDWGLTLFEEPFKKFRAHGLLIRDGAKMSKSRGNVVNPDEYIRAYGADALRMYLMFLGPFEQGGDFRDDGIRGITRFLERAWRFCSSYKERKTTPIHEFHSNDSNNSGALEYLSRILHKTIKKVTEDIEGLQYNTAISALMILLNKFEESPEAVTKEHVAVFLRLLAPFAPFISEELWSRFFANKKSGILDSRSESGHSFHSIHHESWPKYNPKFVKEETFELVIQVNGKVRGRVTLPIGASEEDAKKAALGPDSVRKYVIGDPRKVIFVPNKLINFVV